jgi:mannose-1-phosphate guanylyltransferase
LEKEIRQVSKRGQEMQAAILAGGLGTRLKPITQRIPKVMLPINGKPFLLYLLELLRKQGVTEIVLCIGYLGEEVRNFLQDGESFGLKIRYSQERERLLGTGGALRQAQNLLDEYFLVINGDTYLPINYGDVERTFLQCGKKALMVVYDNREHTGTKNNVELGDDFMIIRHDKENSAPPLKYVDAGALVLRREALNLIEEGHPISLEKGLYPTLIQQNEMKAYITEQRFYDIANLEQLEAFDEFAKRGLK